MRRKQARTQLVTCIGAMALLLTVALAPKVCAATKIKLFILAGQSNSVGMGQASALPIELKQPQPAIKFYPAAEYDDGKPMIGWEALQPAYWCGRGPETPGEYPWCEAGPYLTLGRDLALAMPNDSIAIILIGIGNTTLATDWRPPSSGGPGQWYNNLINGTKKAIVELGPNYEVEIVGLCWMQGESDAFSATDANAYQTNLTNFIKDVRSSFGIPRMPFVIAQIDSFAQWSYANIVRPLQAATARTVSNTAVFDTYHYPKTPDGGHYNYQGIQVIGSGFAANMLRLMGNPAPGTFVEPSDLTATTSNDGRVTLTWRDNSSTETGFKIERRTGNGTFAEIGSVAAGTTNLVSYPDQTALSSQVYTYRVKAVNVSSSSGFSNELAVTPLGTGTGLRAEYFKDTTLTTLAVSRTDTSINFAWGSASPATGVPAGSKFSVRWTGFIQPRYTDTYTLFVESDMTARVWVDNKQIVNQWSWAPFDIKDSEHEWANTFPVHCGSIRLTAGQVYPIKVEYYVTRNSGAAYCRLRWQTPVCQEMQIVPKSQFYVNATPIRDDRGLSPIPGRQTMAPGKLIVRYGQAQQALSHTSVFDTRGRAICSLGANHNGGINRRLTGNAVYISAPQVR